MVIFYIAAQVIAILQSLVKTAASDDSLINNDG